VFANILIKRNVTTLYQLPYFPDLSSPDYFLFLKFRKGIQFADVIEILEAVTDELRRSKTRNFRLLSRK